MNDQFEKSLISKIKNEHISPKPRWHFLLKDFVVWAVGLSALVIGSLAVSVMIYLYRGDDLAFHLKTGSLGEFLLLATPYFWIFFLAAFTFLIYFNIKHTKKGYKYGTSLIVASSVFFSVILGVFFFRIGLGAAIDNILGEKAPYYEAVFNPRMLFWHDPESGRLIGVLAEKIAEDNSLIIIDIKSNEWTVDISGIGMPLMMNVNDPVRFFGKKTSGNTFRAEEAFPVGPGKAYMRRFHSPCPMCPPPRNAQLKFSCKINFFRMRNKRQGPITRKAGSQNQGGQKPPIINKIDDLSGPGSQYMQYEKNRFICRHDGCFRDGRRHLRRSGVQ